MTNPGLEEATPHVFQSVDCNSSNQNLMNGASLAAENKENILKTFNAEAKTIETVENSYDSIMN